MSREYTTRTSERGQRIREVGKAENQPVSPEVIEVAHEEIARLKRDVQRLQTWHDNLKAAAAEKDETIRAQSERIGDLVADVWRLESEIARLHQQNENQAQTIRVQAETTAMMEQEVQAFASRSAKELAAVAREDIVRSLQEEVAALREAIARMGGEAIELKAGRRKTKAAVATLAEAVKLEPGLSHILGGIMERLSDAVGWGDSEQNTPQNPPICPKEPPLAPETANVSDVPVAVHTAPSVRRAGGK